MRRDSLAEGTVQSFNLLVFLHFGPVIVVEDQGRTEEKGSFISSYKMPVCFVS